jgi:hypothetical protein
MKEKSASFRARIALRRNQFYVKSEKLWALPMFSA